MAREISVCTLVSTVRCGEIVRQWVRRVAANAARGYHFVKMLRGRCWRVMTKEISPRTTAVQRGDGDRWQRMMYELDRRADFFAAAAEFGRQLERVLTA